MKFIIKTDERQNIINLTRKIGYHFLNENKEKKELNFIRPLGKRSYPRFHLYLKIEGEILIFNLHLDQKKPSYKDTRAHAGEYESEPVQKEVERIKQIIIM